MLHKARRLLSGVLLTTTYWLIIIVLNLELTRSLTGAEWLQWNLSTKMKFWKIICLCLTPKIGGESPFRGAEMISNMNFFFICGKNPMILIIYFHCLMRIDLKQLQCFTYYSLYKVQWCFKAKASIIVFRSSVVKFSTNCGFTFSLKGKRWSLCCVRD